jgi:integrase
MTVADIISCYLYHAQSTLEHGTFEKTRQVLRTLTDHCGSQCLALCKGLDLLDWLQKQTKWRSDWTKMRALGIAKRPFAWAVDVGLTQQNPFYRVKWRQGLRGKPLPADAFQRLMRVSPPQFRRVLVFLRWSGARPGELMKLTWQDYDDERKCFVRHTHKTSKKTRKPRTIVLHPVCFKMVEFLRRRQRFSQEPHVFLNGLGIRWDRESFYLRWRAIKRRAGMPKGLRLYGLRHSFGTQAVKRGMHLKVLAELLGHADTRMSEYYAHLGEDTSQLRAAVTDMFS